MIIVEKNLKLKKSNYELGERKGHKHYCSKSCAIKAQKTGILVKCNNCGKEFYIAKRLSEKSDVHYCSRKCSMIGALKIKNETLSSKS